MRTSIALSLCGLVLGMSGCIIPVASKVTSGHQYSKEALAFLKQPGTTRDEVIATLGHPLFESPATRTLVYVWHETPRYVFLPVEQIFGVDDGLRASKFDGTSEQWALFIALDERGIVVAHEDRYIETRSLEEECLDWRRNK